MRRTTTLILALLLMSLPSLAAPAGEKHLLLGTWSVDVSKLEQDDPPRSVIWKLVEAGGGRYHLSVDIVTHEGNAVHAGDSTFSPDRSLVTSTKPLEVDVAAFSMPNRRTLVMAGALGGYPSHTRIWTLSDDGESMTETIVGHIDGKTPHIRIANWTRIRSAD